MRTGSLVVVVPEELESGFRLAGVETVATASAAAAQTAVDRLTADRIEGVVAVYEPYLVEFPQETIVRLEQSLQPVVIGLPSGLHEPSGGARRARIAAMLTRAVGYQVTFGAREES